MKSTKLNEVLTAAEAEQLWRLKPGTVRRACREGRVEAWLSAGTWLTTLSQTVKAYAAKSLEGDEMNLYTIETVNGTLRYSTKQVDGGYVGKVAHDLHKHPRFKGRTLRRHSKLYKTERGARGWADKQVKAQKP